MTPENYAPRRSAWLRDFDRSVTLIQRELMASYSEADAQALIAESHRAYEALIPHIPYLGGRSPLLIFLLPTSRYLALYQAFRRQGRPVAEAGRLIYLWSEAELAAMPALARWAIGWLWFSPWFLGRLRQRAAESQLQRYPGGYVFTYVEGDGRTFDYGIDYTECASCKLLRAQNALELAPYVCATDKITSEQLGWGLTRTMTLAEGGAKCDFRFKKGGRTNVGPLASPLRSLAGEGAKPDTET